MATSFLDPEKILNQLKLKSNMTAADFGSGSGGWAIPLAKKLEKGKVYAIDILEEPLSALRSKAQLEKVWNIETIKSDAEEASKILKESCDLVLMTNLLFEAEDKEKVLEEGKKVLKKGGKILVVDWKKEAPFGPQKDRVLPGEVKKLAKKFDLKVEKEFEAGPYHWGLILLK
jgi:ubiquinone/menaquinone biosynthesis C-methylase UbiE